MHGAVVPIAYVAGNGSSSQIAWNNIPQTYQDLMIVVSARETGSGTGLTSGFLRLGAGTIDTGNNYSSTYLQGDGSSVASYRQTSLSYPYTSYIPLSGTTAGIYSSTTIHILNYRSSTYKTFLSRSASDMNGSGYSSLHCGLWQNTSAIQNVLVATSAQAFTTGTTFTLYGVRTVGQ
jgi:hypothetical protein